MDIYQLILDQGLIGALEYSGEIDNKNYKLASDIDKIVWGMCRTAQFIPFNPYPATPTAPAQPSAVPTQSEAPAQYAVPTYDPSRSVGESPSVGVGGLAAGAVTTLVGAKLAKIGPKLLYQFKLPYFKGLIDKMAAGTANTNEILSAQKILGKVPRVNFGSKPMIDFFLNEANTKLAGNPDVLSSLFNNSANWLSKPSDSLLRNIMNRGVGKSILSIFDQIGTKPLHPAVEKFIDMANGFTMDQKILLQKELGGLNIPEALNKLKDLEKSKIIPYGADVLETALQSPTSKVFNASEEALKATKTTSKAGILAEIFEGLSKKFPWAGGFFSVAGKVIGPLAIILDAKGVFDEYKEYGLSPRFTCNFISTLLGVITVGGAAVGLEPLVPFTGLLWGIMSFGCKLTGHGDTNKLQEAKQTDINAREATVSYNDLSTKDKNTATNYLNQAAGNVEELKKLSQVGLTNRVFDNPVDCVAVLQKELNSGSVIPKTQ